MALREASKLLMMEESVLNTELDKDLSYRPSYHKPDYCVRKTETPNPKPQVPEVKLSVKEAAQMDFDEGTSLPF